MVLRIEDTDASRKTQAFVDAILEPLRWLGIDWDEGPYFQSDRTESHVCAVQRLVRSGWAYNCDLTRDEIIALCRSSGLPEGYHGWSRDRDVQDGPGVVVRFRVPNDQQVVVNDIVRGRVEFASHTIEDFVIRRGNGTPTFHIANTVDDHDMGITHVIRGEDLLNTTPRVLLLWRALGYGDPPNYAHLPLLVNAQRKKLSKRRDDVALGTYMARGYLPEAMVNALALLGWGPRDGVEIRPIAEIVELFTLAEVNRSPAFFDIDKLNHLNAAYIKALRPARFAELVEPYLLGPDVGWPVEAYRAEVVEALAPDIQQRISVLSEAPQWLRWLFVDGIDSFDQRSWTKAMIKGRAAARVIDEVAEALRELDFKNPDEIEAAVMGVGNRLTAELGSRVMSQAPVRVALTGHSAGIPLWRAMTLLGRDACLARLAAARSRLL